MPPTAVQAGRERPTWSPNRWQTSCSPTRNLANCREDLASSVCHNLHHGTRITTRPSPPQLQPVAVRHDRLSRIVFATEAWNPAVLAFAVVCWTQGMPLYSF